MTTPTDIPAGRPAAVAALDVLVGTWDQEATFEAGYFGPGSDAVTLGGAQTTFTWLDGGFFLIQRMRVDNPDAPNGITIIGAGLSPYPDDAATEPGPLAQHYYDSRGAARVYQMSLDDGVWKLWRTAPGFSQRFSGTLAPDGRTIQGAWEKSRDGVTWEHDFRLTYSKIS